MASLEEQQMMLAQAVIDGATRKRNAVQPLIRPLIKKFANADLVEGKTGDGVLTGLEQAQALIQKQVAPIATLGKDGKPVPRPKPTCSPEDPFVSALVVSNNSVIQNLLVPKTAQEDAQHVQQQVQSIATQIAEALKIAPSDISDKTREYLQKELALAMKESNQIVLDAKNSLISWGEIGQLPRQVLPMTATDLCNAIKLAN